VRFAGGRGALSELDDLFLWIVLAVNQPLRMASSLLNGLGGNIELSAFLR
jgi:hypothetical protein